MSAGRHYVANSVDLVLEQGINPALCTQMLKQAKHQGTCDVGAVFSAPVFAASPSTTESAALAACDFIDTNVREWRTTLRWALGEDTSAATATHVLCTWNGWLHTIHTLVAWLMSGAEGDIPELESYSHEQTRMAALASAAPGTDSGNLGMPMWVVQACAASALELLTQSDVLFTARCVLGLKASLTTLRPPLARSADELCCLQRRNAPSYFARNAFAQQTSATSFVQQAWDTYYYHNGHITVMAQQQVSPSFSEFAAREVAVLSHDRELEAKAGDGGVLPVVCTLCVWMHDPLKAYLASLTAR